MSINPTLPDPVLAEAGEDEAVNLHTVRWLAHVIFRVNARGVTVKNHLSTEA